MTSLPAGKVVPLAVIPVLREDTTRGSFAMAFEMQETHEVLLNGIDIVVEAWLVPNLAFERFRTMDDINLAYTKNARPGEQVVPYFEMMQAGDPLANEIHMRLGKHARPTQMVNCAYVETYNRIINYQRAEVSPNIPKRERLQKDLAQALWPRNLFGHIVPDFDQAIQEGEVALTIAEQNLVLRNAQGGTDIPVAGSPAVHSTDAPAQAQQMMFHPNYGLWPNGTQRGQQAVTNLSGLKADLAGAVAVLENNGVTISLANIDLARKAQVFANIRKKYNGLSEDMLIDLLMDGITIPEQAWRNPTLLKRVQARFGMAKRYASDGDALTQSVVNGVASIEFSIAVPQCPPGGVIMFTAAIAPEQLFERQKDPYLFAADPTTDLPKFLPDHLDPEAVEVVKNDYIDIDHDDPDAIYGYAPSNFMWNNAGPGIGGRFYRPEVDAGFDEDRQALWAVETQNPTLTKDAYLVPADIHLKPFWTSTIDPFDCVTIGAAVIEGNTQFGPMLIESQVESDYDEVMKRVDTGRIVKEPVAP